MRSLSEIQLVDYLVAMLRGEGYRVRTEVSTLGQSADVVAVRGRWVTIIEVKRNHWNRALQQCRVHEHVADFICVAIATRGLPPGLLSAATSSGYGILLFDAECCTFSWKLAPQRNGRVWRPQRLIWAKQLRRVRHAQ